MDDIMSWQVLEESLAWIESELQRARRGGAQEDPVINRLAECRLIVHRLKAKMVLQHVAYVSNFDRENVMMPAAKTRMSPESWNKNHLNAYSHVISPASTECGAPISAGDRESPSEFLEKVLDKIASQLSLQDNADRMCAVSPSKDSKGLFLANQKSVTSPGNDSGFALSDSSSYIATPSASSGAVPLDHFQQQAELLNRRTIPESYFSNETLKSPCLNQFVFDSQETESCEKFISPVLPSSPDIVFQFPLSNVNKISPESKEAKKNVEIMYNEGPRPFEDGDSISLVSLCSDIECYQERLAQNTSQSRHIKRTTSTQTEIEAPKIPTRPPPREVISSLNRQRPINLVRPTRKTAAQNFFHQFPVPSNMFVPVASPESLPNDYYSDPLTKCLACTNTMYDALPTHAYPNVYLGSGNNEQSLIQTSSISPELLTTSSSPCSCVVPNFPTQNEHLNNSTASDNFCYNPNTNELEGSQNPESSRRKTKEVPSEDTKSGRNHVTKFFMGDSQKLNKADYSQIVAKHQSRGVKRLEPKTSPYFSPVVGRRLMTYNDNQSNSSNSLITKRTNSVDSVNEVVEKFPISQEAVGTSEVFVRGSSQRSAGHFSRGSSQTSSAQFTKGLLPGSNGPFVRASSQRSSARKQIKETWQRVKHSVSRSASLKTNND